MTMQHFPDIYIGSIQKQSSEGMGVFIFPKVEHNLLATESYPDFLRAYPTVEEA